MGTRNKLGHELNGVALLNLLLVFEKALLNDHFP